MPRYTCVTRAYLSTSMLIFTFAKKPFPKLHAAPFPGTNKFDAAFADEPTEDMIVQILVDSIADGMLPLSECESVLEDDCEF